MLIAGLVEQQQTPGSGVSVPANAGERGDIKQKRLPGQAAFSWGRFGAAAA